MRHRLFRTLSTVSLLLPLAACDAEIGNDEAAACIFDAVQKDFRASIFWLKLAGDKVPEISMNRATVKECVKSGPSTFDCLVEYGIHLNGRFPDLFATMTGLQPDEAGNLFGMANWRFIKGTDAVRCQILE